MFHVSVLKELTEQQVNEILEIVIEASEIDGARPFSEHVELHLRSGGDRPVIHVIAQNQNQKIVGYGHLDTTDLVEGPSGELVVHPEFRLKGIATQIILEMKKLIKEKPLRLWSHGDIPHAQEFAKKLGFHSVRNVIQMRRSLFSPIEPFNFPSNYKLKQFDPNTDIDKFLLINKTCFVDLPDQSSWSRKDVELRISESWFSAKRFHFVIKRERRSCWFLLDKSTWTRPLP